MNAPFPRSPLRAMACAALAVSALACGVGKESVSDHCPAVASTGGTPNPMGDWNVTNACQVPYARTAADDWCSKLVYNEAQVVDGLFLGQEFIPILTKDPVTGQEGISHISYKRSQDPLDPTKEAADCAAPGCGDFELMLVFAGETTTVFPLACLKQHRPSFSCADLGTKIQMLADGVLPTIQNTTCVETGDACTCKYLVTTATLSVELGRWRVKDGLLVHYPGLLQMAAAADVAISGNEMHLHGHDGLPLLAHDSLRNLDLVRAPPPP